MPDVGTGDVLTLREAAEFLRVSEKTLGDMARSGRMPCQKVGREWRFLRSAIEAWLGHRDGADMVAEPQVQYPLPFPEPAAPRRGQPPEPSEEGFGDTAFTKNRDEPLHRWVPWIAGFSSSFVTGVLETATVGDPREATVLDPFAGVGTTLVEALKRGHNAIGFEINPYAALVCRAKVECARYDLERLDELIRRFHPFMTARAGSLPASKPPEGFRSRAPFFSPKVERKVLHVLDYIAEQDEGGLQDVLRVALGAVLVSVSNYSYEPSLGRRASAGKDDILDADVAGIMARKLQQMATDMAQLQLQLASFPETPATAVRCESFLDRYDRVEPASVDVLVTSPPYLNNYHYIRNTRPHLYWLGFVESTGDLKEMEHTSFGKFWQTVRSGPPVELEVDCGDLPERLAELRERNSEKGVYGGAGWANYAATYFNDCLTFCNAARTLMRPGGTAVVVIGNNILQGIEFKTDDYFAAIAQSCGFQLVEMHRVRDKRTGSSIVRSSVRVGSPKKRVKLHETAVELRASASP